jgi:hypothetical protein
MIGPFVSKGDFEKDVTNIAKAAYLFSQQAPSRADIPDDMCGVTQEGALGWVAAALETALHEHLKQNEVSS